MNKTIVIITAIIVSGLLIGFYIYTQNKSPSEKIKLEDIVIKMVKNSHFSGSSNNTNDKIKNILEDKKGNFKVIGWKAKRIEENTYLVSFTYDENSKKYGWFFEVKPIGEIVRDVSLDQELMQRYNVVYKVTYTEDDEAELRDLVKESYEYRKITGGGKGLKGLIEEISIENLIVLYKYLPPDKQKKAINLERKKTEYNNRILVPK